MPASKPKRGISALLIAGAIFIFIGAAYLAATVWATGLDDPDANTRHLWIFAVLGLAFLVAGGACFWFEVQIRVRNNKLIRDGKYVMAEIYEVCVNYNIRVPGRCPHPYYVMCRYQDMSYNMHMFRSRNLDFDPEPLLKDRMVRVYVDETDYRHYYVDIDGVLPMVMEY